MTNLKPLKLIYNDKAGSRAFKNDLDNIIQIFTQAGFDINILRTTTIHDIDHHLSHTPPHHFHTIVAAGGDGTINAVVNAMMRHGIKSRLGIIPAGTANDFARFLHIEKPYTQAAQVIAGGYTTPCDLGRIGDNYFINVLGVGDITNVSTHVDTQLKNTMGNMAYYLKAVEKLGTLAPVPITIKNSQGTITEDIHFFLALNTGGAGGFDNIAPKATINDGKLDMIAIKHTNIADILTLIMKFFKGEHIDDYNVIYFQDNYTELIFDSKVETNVDGEAGPQGPLTIQVVPNAIQIYTKEI